MRIPLHVAAEILEANTSWQFSFEVEEVYEDYGANMLWDNIIVYDNIGDWSWQVLYRSQMDIFEYGTSEQQWKLLEELIADFKKREEK